MASPQLENGYTRIAHEILESISNVQMSGTEWQFLMCLFRKTYGFQKTEDWITGSQIVQMTGLKKERVSEAKKRLLERNMITENHNKISFQKNYENWVELRKSVTKVTEKRNKVLRKSVNTIDNKDNIYKGEKSPSKSKQKNMSWNKQIEDIVIDADTGEEVKPKEKPKRHFKEVYTVFEEVLGKLPANWFVNTTQQKCADNLFTERGITAIRNALLFYKENKEKEFCPQITQPSDLDAKWSKLGEFKKKLQ